MELKGLGLFPAARVLGANESSQCVLDSIVKTKRESGISTYKLQPPPLSFYTQNVKQRVVVNVLFLPMHCLFRSQLGREFIALHATFALLLRHTTLFKMN